jgi:hypothetical protein
MNFIYSRRDRLPDWFEPVACWGCGGTGQDIFGIEFCHRCAGTAIDPIPYCELEQ